MHLSRWPSPCPRGALWLLKRMWWKSLRPPEREAGKMPALRYRERNGEKMTGGFNNNTKTKASLKDARLVDNKRRTLWADINGDILTYLERCPPFCLHHRSRHHLPRPVSLKADVGSWGAGEWSHLENSRSAQDDQGHWRKQEKHIY